MAQEMNLWTRITSESPKFFNRLIKIALSVAGVATTIVALEAAGTVVLDPIISKILGYLITAGVIAAAVAKTTMSDTGTPNTETEKEDVK